MKNNHQPFIMEITIISAQGLKTSSPTFFSHRLRPFITLTTVPPPTTNGDKPCHVYQTRVCDEEGINPTWGDKFYLPLDSTFFTHSHRPYSSSSIYLQIYTKRLMAGKSQLGWCQIPASDIFDGFAPVGSVRHLSYRLRDKDGSKSRGVVNIAVRLQGQVPVYNNSPGANMMTHSPVEGQGVGQTVIGIPVTMITSHVSRTVISKENKSLECVTSRN